MKDSTITGSVVDAGTIDATGAGIKIDSNAKLLAPARPSTSPASILIGGVSNAGIIDAKVGVDVTSAHGVNVFDDGTIIGSGGTAVEFKAAGNDFTLGAGYVVSGAVVGVAGDALQLGGAAAANFNLAAVGTQYKGFSEFNVVGGTWTVSGSGGHWSVDSGAEMILSGGDCSATRTSVPAERWSFPQAPSSRPRAAARRSLPAP